VFGLWTQKACLLVDWRWFHSIHRDHTWGQVVGAWHMRQIWCRSYGLMMFALVCAFSWVCACGCAGSWHPSFEHVEPQPAEKPLDLSAYLRAERFGKRTYRRRELPLQEGQAQTTYIREMTAERMIEGRLVGQKLLPLARYLEPEAVTTTAVASTQPREVKRAQSPFKRGKALLFRLAEPMQLIPPELTEEELIESTTPIRYYDYSGRQAGVGTLTRSVAIEGLEDVECPAGRFENCLRINVNLIVQFSWWLRMQGSGYLWLSPDVGEVRRVHQISGWFLIFWFGSAYEYDLLSYDDMGGKVLTMWPTSAKWAYGAIMFDRILPKPQVAGMLVDFADTAPAP